MASLSDATAREVNSRGNGNFRMQGIPPGEYKLFTWDDIDDGAWFDPEFIRNHENSGSLVRIRDGSNAAMTIGIGRP